MPDAPDRIYLDRISSETDFLRDPLEKVYRLLELLHTIAVAPGVGEKLLLKGGTAIQFVYLDYKRLSVDIDFNYVGSVERDVMMEDRQDIHLLLFRIFKEFNYEIEKGISAHAEEQYVLAYTNSAGNRDRIKVEINYLERLPALSPVRKPLKHPFDILKTGMVPTFGYEEVIAQKTRALITRATPRDLYDVHLISQSPAPFDRNLYRKTTLFYLCLAPGDVRGMTMDKINSIDKRDVRRNLAPLLKRREYAVDLTGIKKSCLGMVEPILALTSEEREFFDRFYDDKAFEQELLFGDIKLECNLIRHPGVQWRLQN